MTVMLSWLAQSRALRHIALFLTFSWVAGMGVFLFEHYAQWRFQIAYAVIDGIVILALLARANRPGHRFFDLTVFIVGILVLQTLVVAGLTPTNLHWTMKVILNRTFEILHVSIWIMAGLRILRIYAPRSFEKLFGMPPGTATRAALPEFPGPQSGPRNSRGGAYTAAAVKDGWWARWTHGLFVDICADDN